MTPSAATLDVGVAIVSYNTRELTAACLEATEAALAHAGIAGHIWLVDNASSDGSADMVRERYPHVTLIEPGSNRGFAGGANIALRAMKQVGPPRHALLLNTDTACAEDAIGLLLAHMEAHPEVACAGAQLRYGDGTFQHSAFRFPTLWQIILDLWPLHHRLLASRLNGRYSRRLYARGQPFVIDHPLGAVMMLRWRALEQVGLLDEGYFMYSEEIDWCLRARRAGWQCHCVPQALVTHYEGQSTRQFREAMFVALWRSRFRLYARYYCRPFQWAARLLVRLAMRQRASATRRALRRGAIEPGEANRRLAAYRQIGEL